MTGPVYTIENECQDCYKCLRHCHAKAIRIVKAKASVIPESCVSCGECVKVCPAQAKKIRDDLPRLKSLLSSGAAVYASVAPSFAGYFKNIDFGRLVAALRKAGFTGASETAHGAESVSSSVRTLLKNWDKPLMISSACPACVDYIRKYHEDFAPYISPVPSPVRAHAGMLRARYGDEVKVVFFGPCAAKKNEADRAGNGLDLALTFKDLQNLLSSGGIDLNQVSPEEPALGAADEGRFYSLEGGMNDTLRDGSDEVRHISVSGLDNLSRVLGDAPPPRARRTVFVECLACPGGCVNGPAMPRDSFGLSTILATDATASIKASNRIECVEAASYVPEPISETPPTEEEIIAALHRVGKFTDSDMINCGACGYESCREFAKALHVGKAEEAMCHNFLRRNFERTSNALIKFIPAAVVIVDGTLQVTEANRNFAELANMKDVFDAIGDIAGAHISRTMPELEPLFLKSLENDEEITRYRQQYNGKIVNVSVFPIAKGKCAGAVIQDVTRNEFAREKVAEKAREVIRKNVVTVQEVARLFGEHIAETEIMLSEFAGTYESAGGVKRFQENVMESGGFND